MTSPATQPPFHQVDGLTGGVGTISIMRRSVDAWVSEEAELVFLFIRGDNSITRKRPLLNIYKGPDSRQRWHIIATMS
jgi:hypothetical protein